MALVRKIPADSFKTMPDAITLEKQFAVMYNVRLYGEEIYVFCRNHYVAVSDTTLLQMMRGTFADVIESPPNVNSGARRSSIFAMMCLRNFAWTAHSSLEKT